MSNNQTHHKPPQIANFRHISLDLLDDPQRPLRSDLSPESVQDLVSSIRQVGIIEPLIVKAVDNRFEIVAGHRRAVAAQIVGLAQVPCLVVEANDIQTEALKLHENFYREQISPINQSEHFAYLQSHHKLSTAKIGELIGKSHAYVADRLAILNWPQELKEALHTSQINFSVAREFGRVEDISKMREFLHYAIVSGVTPTIAKRWVEEYKHSIQPQQQQPNGAQQTTVEPPPLVVQTSCIYCKQPLRYDEAQVVHIHHHCLAEVQTPTPDTTT